MNAINLSISEPFYDLEIESTSMVHSQPLMNSMVWSYSDFRSMPISAMEISTKIDLFNSNKILDERSRVGLMQSEIWFARNQMNSPKSWYSKITHAINCLTLALMLSTNFIVLDVDGVFSSVFPTSSDLTLMNEDGIFCFIDITSSTASISKLENLIKDVSNFFCRDSSSHFASVIQFSSGPIENLDEAFEQTVLQSSWASETEMFICKLQKTFSTLRNKDLKLLSDKLDSILRPCILNVLPKKDGTRNSLDALRPLTEGFYHELCSVLGFDPKSENIKDEITSMIDGRVKYPISVYETAHDSLKNNSKDTNIDKFIFDAFDDIKVLSRPKGLIVHPPITTHMSADDLDKINHNHDYFFWVNREAAKRIRNYKPGNLTVFCFWSNGEITPLKQDDHQRINFDRRQDMRTWFGDGHVAYVNLVLENNEIYVDQRDGREYFKKEFKIRTGKDTVEGTDYVLRYDLKPRKFHQLLFNPRYAMDDNLKTYLERSDPSKRHRAYRDFTNLGSMMSRSEVLINKTLDSLVPTHLEFLQQLTATSSKRNKVSMIVQAKAPPAVSVHMGENSFVNSSTIFNYIEAMNIQASAFTTFTGIKHSENCVVFLNSGDYALWGVWYLPGTYPEFKTTWRRFYSLTEFMVDDMVNMSHVQNCNGSYKSVGVEINTDEVKNHPIFSKESPSAIYACRLMKLQGALETATLRKTRFVCSKFHSVDRNSIEWELELSAKAIFKSYSLCEMREKFYAASCEGDDEYKGISQIAEKEIALNVLLMLINRQQHSVQSTAYRYLHQALGSRDFNPYQIVDKMKDTTCKSWLEIYYVSKMLVVFKSALIIRLNNDLNTIRSNNREIFTVAPDLIMASNSPILNKATYNKPNVFNKDKQFRVEAEAECVQNLWDQVLTLQDVKVRFPDRYAGMPLSLLKHLNYEWDSSLKDFLRILDSYTEEIREYSSNILLDEKPQNLTNNILHELWALTLLRIDFDPVSARECLSGKEVSELFTMKGSSVARKLEKVGDNVAVRKATAMAVMLSRLYSGKPENSKAEALASEEFQDLNLDQYAVFDMLMRAEYVDDVEMICQFSEKDAPGKNREITTMNIEWSVTFLLCEKIAQVMSARIPEDLITHAAKEDTIYKTVRNFEAKIDNDPNLELLYINQDKSKYGPNRKNSSMLLTAMALSSDEETFSCFSRALFKSSQRKVAYPHEILIQCLNLQTESRELAKDHLKGRYSVKLMSKYDLNFVHRGKTSIVMSKILEQYREGNFFGDKGTFYAKPVEGMPGQGIAGTISSIQHAAVARLTSRIIKEELNWDWQTFVTSDDSMTCITFPRKDSLMATNYVKYFITQFNQSCGLIENQGKFVASSQGTEMNGFFLLKGEPCVPIWKYGIAYCSLLTSGNIGEDMYNAVSKGNDLHRFGGSIFLSSILSACVLSMVMDAYRIWGPFYEDMKRSALESCDLWFRPPEVLGLPVIDPVGAIISPIGARFASVKSEINDENDMFNMSRYFVESALSASKKDQVLDHEHKQNKTRIAENGDLIFTLDEGVYAMPSERLPPTVNGLLGKILRRQDDVRVAKEMGNLVNGLKGRSQKSRYSVHSLIHKLCTSLEVPMKNGVKSRRVFDHHRDIAHGLNFRYMLVSENSFFPDDMKGKHISIEELKIFMMDKGKMTDMHRRFKERIKGDIPLTPHIESLAIYIKGQMDRCKIVSDFLWESKMSMNQLEKQHFEHIKESGRDRSTRRRLIKLSDNKSPSGGYVFNEVAIKSEIIRKYIGNHEIKHPKYRYMRGYGTGSMDVEEAILQTELTIERIKTYIPKEQIIYAETMKGTYDKRRSILDWLLMNPRIGYNFKATRKMISECYNDDYEGLDGGQIDEDEHFDKLLISSYTTHDLNFSGSFGSNLEMNNLKFIYQRTALPYTIFKGNLGVLNERIIMKNLPKMKIELMSMSNLMNKMSMSTWYGNANLRVKFRSFRFWDNGEESFLTIRLTQKSSLISYYNHYIVIMRQSGSRRIKEGSHEFKAIKEAAQDQPWILKEGFPDNVIGHDVYKVIDINENQIWETGILGGRLFLKLPDTLHVPLPIKSNLPKFENVIAVLDDQKKRYQMNSSSINHKIAYNLKKPIQRMSKEELDYWYIALHEFEEKLLNSGKHPSPRCCISCVDLASSLLVDGETKGLFLPLMDDPPDLNNVVKHDFISKISVADDVSMRIKTYGSLANILWSKVCDIFDIISQRYLTYRLNKKLNNNMLSAWQPVPYEDWDQEVNAISDENISPFKPQKKDPMLLLFLEKFDSNEVTGDQNLQHAPTIESSLMNQAFEQLGNFDFSKLDLNLTSNWGLDGDLTEENILKLLKD